MLKLTLTLALVAFLPLAHAADLADEVASCTNTGVIIVVGTYGCTTCTTDKCTTECENDGVVVFVGSVCHTDDEGVGICIDDYCEVVNPCHPSICTKSSPFLP